MWKNNKEDLTSLYFSYRDALILGHIFVFDSFPAAEVLLDSSKRTISQSTKININPSCTAHPRYVSRNSRSRRYILHKRKWNRCLLTWSLRDPFNLFKSNKKFLIARETIGKAMKNWENASQGNLKLMDLSPDSYLSPLNKIRSSDIDIFFARYHHGDQDHEEFDGQGGMAAHSSYPPGGVIHFDASEKWAISRKQGIHFYLNELSLYEAALHEIGHVLGLRHSDYRHSVMNPYYRNFVLNGKNEIQLSKDDIEAVRKLFGGLNCQ